MAWRVIAAAVGAAIVLAIARGAPPLPLLLPPVLIPAGIGWTFGRTLRRGRTPLVERVARGFHAPAVPSDPILHYARRVTWAWALLLGSIALANLLLITALDPGGLLALAGVTPRWAVSPAAFAWFSNTGTYLLIGALLVVEFSIRIWRFPDYRFRNPLHFMREARTRMPNIVTALRVEIRSMSVPAQHPVFHGHFPGNPIVPGVMLLEWVTREVAQVLGLAPSGLRVREAKFFTPLAPLQQATLSFEPGERRCAFVIQRDAVQVARGVLEWDGDD